jgi:hypothetical protein
MTGSEVGCQRGQPIVLLFCPAVFDYRIAVLGVARLVEALAERCHQGRRLGR